jgi:hypothetical protein
MAFAGIPLAPGAPYNPGGSYKAFPRNSEGSPREK